MRDRQGSPQFPIWEEGGCLYTADRFSIVIPVGLNATNSLAPGIAAQANFTIEADADFEWFYSTIFATLNGGTFPQIDNQMIPISLQIKDGGSGRELFSAPVPITSIAGIGREPFVEIPIGPDEFGNPQRRKFMSKATVNFFFASFDPTNTWDNVILTLHGRKIFDITPRGQRQGG